MDLQLSLSCEDRPCPRLKRRQLHEMYLQRVGSALFVHGSHWRDDLRRRLVSLPRFHAACSVHVCRDVSVGPGMCCLSQGVGRHNAQPRQGPVEIVVAATSRPPVISGDLRRSGGVDLREGVESSVPQDDALLNSTPTPTSMWEARPPVDATCYQAVGQEIGGAPCRGGANSFSFSRPLC